MKRFEIALKTVAAWCLAALFWRPWRSAKIGSSQKVLVVRIDNRVGEALLTTPLIRALEGKTVDVLLHPKCVRVLEGHSGIRRLIPAERSSLYAGLFSSVVRALRAERYDVVINAASWTGFSAAAALWARIVAPHSVVVGPALGPAKFLCDVSVTPRTDTSSEALQRLHLASPLGVVTTDPRLSFRAPKISPALEALISRLKSVPSVVVNPGGRLSERRVPPEVFAAAAKALNRSTLVTWGPGEEALAQRVVDLIPGAELAPPTDLDGLAAVMAAAHCTVCNNTGPMHLSVAVGAPTLAFFMGMDLARWAHKYAPHAMVDLTPFAGSIESLEREAIGAAVRFSASA